ALRRDHRKDRHQGEVRSPPLRDGQAGVGTDEGDRFARVPQLPYARSDEQGPAEREGASAPRQGPGGEEDLRRLPLRHRAQGAGRTRPAGAGQGGEGRAVTAAGLPEAIETEQAMKTTLTRAALAALMAATAAVLAGCGGGGGGDEAPAPAPVPVDNTPPVAVPASTAAVAAIRAASAARVNVVF